MKKIFRDRKTHYPRTYFILKQGSFYYLLFWFEYGRDNSLYIWFDDSVNNGWEVTATHRQFDIIGDQEINFNQSLAGIFNPHISWHGSGQVHVRGYDSAGKSGARVISNRIAASFDQLKSGVTIPFSQIIFPTVNCGSSLDRLSFNLQDIFDLKRWVGILDQSGLHVFNDGAMEEAFFVIDERMIPSNRNLALDICVHHKRKKVNFNGLGGYKMREVMVHPESISLHKGGTDVAACIRVFSVDVLSDARDTKSVVATCFNEETIDILRMQRM